MNYAYDVLTVFVYVQFVHLTFYPLLLQLTITGWTQPTQKPHTKSLLRVHSISPPPSTLSHSSNQTTLTCTFTIIWSISGHKVHDSSQGLPVV